MTKVTITLTSDADLLGVFLHHPGSTKPEPLPGVAHSVRRALDDGTYHVSVAGTGLVPATPVKIKFAATNHVVRGGRAKADGTIGLFTPFNLQNGTVS